MLQLLQELDCGSSTPAGAPGSSNGLQRIVWALAILHCVAKEVAAAATANSWPTCPITPLLSRVVYALGRSTGSLDSKSSLFRVR